MEFKRIISRHKMWFFTALLLILNIWLYYSEQSGSLNMMHESGADMYYAELDREQGLYVDGYDSYVEDILAKKDDMLSLSIFSDTSSFAYKNIMKTYDDFWSVKDVTPVKVRDEAMNSFMRYNKMSYTGFFAIAFVVLYFFEERKKGMWHIVHSSKRGRKRLAAVRIGILSFYSVMISFVMTLSSLIVGFGIYGGVGILGAPVRSVRIMKNCILNLDTYQFLIYYILMYAGALFINGIILWLILGLFHNISIGMVFSSLLYGIELLLYYTVTPSGSFAVLKFFNPVAFLFTGSTFTEYINFSFAGLLLNTRELITVSLVVLSILSGIVCVYVMGSKKPAAESLRIEEMIIKLSDSMRRTVNHLPLTGYEIYKYLIHGKGFVIMLILAYTMLSRIDNNMYVTGPEEDILQEFYADNTGEINNESIQILAAMKEELEAKEALDGMYYEADRKAYGKLDEQVENAEYLEQYGVKGWFIDSKGYEQLTGDNTMGVRIVDGVIGALALILMLATTGSSENESQTNFIIRCTKRGRKPLQRRKLIYSLGCSITVAYIVMGTELYDIIRRYHLRGMMAPVQNIKSLMTFPLAVNILTFLIIWYISRLIIYILIAVLVMGISGKCMRNDRAYLVSLALFPAGIPACGFNSLYIIIAVLISVVFILSCTAITIQRRHIFIGAKRQ